MKENLSKLDSETFSAKEEHILDWNEVMKNLQNNTRKRYL